jgi:hypothetical protein
MATTNGFGPVDFNSAVSVLTGAPSGKTPHQHAFHVGAPPCDCTRDEDGTPVEGAGSYFCQCYGTGIAPQVCNDCGDEGHATCGAARVSEAA